MPKQKCEKCGKTISFSKLDKFENVHTCHPKLKDRIITKPVLNIETKDADKVLVTGTSDADIGETKTETSTLPHRNKYTGRRD